jgi:ribosomal protein S18 acetylase RimI-like enzyme
MLFQATEEAAKYYNIVNARLHVEHNNLSARRLYERIGFFLYGEEKKDYYGCDRHAFCMKAILPLIRR